MRQRNVDAINFKPNKEAVFYLRLMLYPRHKQKLFSGCHVQNGSCDSYLLVVMGPFPGLKELGSKAAHLMCQIIHGT